MEDREVARGAFRARGGDAGLFRRVHAQRVDEAVAIVVGELHDLAVADLAVRFGQPRIAFGAQPLGLLVVDDLVRLEHRAVVVDLHIADGRDALVGVVVVDLARLHEHLVFRRGGADGGLGRAGKVRFCAAAGSAIGSRRPRTGRATAQPHTASRTVAPSVKWRHSTSGWQESRPSPLLSLTRCAERFGAETAHADSTDLKYIAALFALAFGSPKSRKPGATPPKIIA